MKTEDVLKEKEDLEREMKELSVLIKNKIIAAEASILSNIEESEKTFVKETIKNMIESVNDVNETIFEISQSTLSMFFEIDEKADVIDIQEAKRYFALARECSTLNRIIDSEVIHMKGDLLITDPCYICIDREPIGEYPSRRDFFTYSSESEYPDYKKVPLESLDELERALVECGIEDGCRSKLYMEEDKKYREALGRYREANLSDWDKCEFGKNMEAIGIQNYLCRDTIYGDWSCTAYDRDTKQVLGHFCADAGLVGVFLLDEVLAYNPDLELNEWAATIIRGFEGDVQIIVDKVTGVYKEDSEYHKKGECWEDYNVKVVGSGNINFITEQTGL